MIEAYKIGVSITMQNGVSGVLKVIQKDLLGIKKAVDFTQGSFTRMHLAVAGAAGVVAGGAFLEVFKSLAEAGGAVVNQQAKMAQLGISNRDIALETADAYKNISISGTTIAGNMAAALKLRSIFGGTDFKEADMAVPAFLKAQFALQGAGINPTSIEDFIKPLDVMGAFRTGNKLDPAKFGPAIQMAVSAVLSSGGLLTGAAFQRAIQLAGPAAAQMGEQTFFNTMLEPLLALGTKAARGLQYGGSTFIGGQMSKASASMLDRLGITSAADYTHEGGRWTLDQNKIAGSKLLDKGDIIDWISDYFVPDAAKAHLNPMVAAASLPQTLQALISTVYELGPQIAKSIAQQAQANAANPYTAAQAAWSGATGNISTALTGLWQALGTPAAYMGVTVLNRISDGIRNFTTWLGAHPQVASLIDKTLLALSVGLTVLGSAAIVSGIALMVGPAGYLALTATGIAGLGLVLHTFPSILTDAEKGLQKFVWGILNPFAKGSWLNQGPGGPSPHPGMHWAVYGKGSGGWVPDNPTVPQQQSGSGSWKPTEDAVKKAYQIVADWIFKGAPVTASGAVAVTNPGDIGKASAAATIRNLHQGFTAPNSGPTGFNPSASPPGSSASGH